MRRFYNYGLTIAMVGLFTAFLIATTFAGLGEYNQEQSSHGQAAISWSQYLTTGAFGEAIFENWESEFFQMFAYVTLTAFLFQIGSPESKSPNKKEEVDEDPFEHRKDPNAPRIVRYGSITALKIYSHSLGLAFFMLWVGTFLLHAWTGSNAYSNTQMAHGEDSVSFLEYLTTSQFWFESMQNYQSEFMVMGVLLVLGIFLRERGSPESKPVHAPHIPTTDL